MSRGLGGKFHRRQINWHWHSLCGHLCPCSNQISFNCLRCRQERAIADARMSTEQVIERRA